MATEIKMLHEVIAQLYKEVKTAEQSLADCRKGITKVHKTMREREEKYEKFKADTEVKIKKIIEAKIIPLESNLGRDENEYED